MTTLKYKDPDSGEWKSVALSAGDSGTPEVSVGPTEPAGVLLWVDPEDFQGDSGWQGFDARYLLNTDGTAHGTLAFKPTLEGVDPDIMGGIEARTDSGMTFLASDATGVKHTVFVMNHLSASAWKLLAGIEGFRLQNGYGGAVTFEVTKAGAVRVIAAPTAADHAVNKAYVDGRVVIAATAPASPAVGTIWATP